jgi:hypothetical protein
MSTTPVATNASITDRRIAAAQAEQQAKVAAEVAQARSTTHQRETHQKADRLASLEADREQNMLAAALDRPLPAPAPNAAEMETLRADIEISKRVGAELQRRAAAAEKAHTEAQRVCKAHETSSTRPSTICATQRLKLWLPTALPFTSTANGGYHIPARTMSRDRWRTG